MHSYRDIKFTASQTTSKLTAGKVCYQGQVIHNHTLDEAETREAFADYARLPIPMGNLAIDSVGAFIAEEIAKGNRLDFGAFSVGLKMRGGLPAANAPFNPKVNDLVVELTPGKGIKKATKYLKPVNATGAKYSYVFKTEQTSPYKMEDAFLATGTRTLIAFGGYIRINPAATGEGVWIENDVGDKLLKGRILPGSDACRVSFELTGDVDPGLYWLAIYSRISSNGPLLRCHRRITAK